MSTPRRILGVVDRPNDTRFRFDELQHIPLIKGMVAKGHAIRARLKQRFGMIAGQAHPARGVLAIDHNEIQPPLITQLWQGIGHRMPPRPAYDIAQKYKSHIRSRRRSRAAWQGPRVTPRMPRPSLQAGQFAAANSRLGTQAVLAA